MNPETGRVYTGREEIEAAEARGEKLVPLSPEIGSALAERERRDEWQRNRQYAERFMARGSSR